MDKRRIFPILKPAILAIVGVERRIFFATGRKLSVLAAYHRAEARHIQRLLDRQHGAKTKTA